VDPAERQAIETQLAEAALELLSSAMAVKAQAPSPIRVQDLALVLGRSDSAQPIIATVTILDPAQRVQSVRYALTKLRGFAFCLLFDGFIWPEGEVKRDALLLVTGTEWGVWTASATPYERQGLGAVFAETLNVPEAAEMYHAVFRPPT